MIGNAHFAVTDEPSEYAWFVDGSIGKMLKTVIEVEITAEDLRERDGQGKRRKKPIENAARRIYGKMDTWGAWKHLWFQWTEIHGGKCKFQYECKEEDLNAFLSDPKPCTLRFERIA